MMSQFRQERLNTLIKQAVTKIVHFDIRDKRVKSITIEDVKVSSDLHYATIYFSLWDDRNEKSTLIGLKSARKFIRKRLAERLNLKYTPEIRFVHDTLEQDAHSIESLIEEEGKRYDH
jgi:ribosome-binding factor A